MGMLRGTAGQMPDEVTNGLFLQGSQGWTLTAGWALTSDPRGLTHTAGTTTVSQTTSATHTTVTYNIEVAVVGRTAGDFVILAGAGDVAAETVAVDGVHVYETIFTDDAVLSFVPDTAFDGTILYVRVRALKKQP
jgi:hypothetical protein